MSSACRWLVAVDEDSTLFYYCWKSCSQPAASTHQPQTSNQTLRNQSNQSREDVFRGSEGMSRDKPTEEAFCESREGEGSQVSEEDEVMLSLKVPIYWQQVGLRALNTYSGHVVAVVVEDASLVSPSYQTITLIAAMSISVIPI